MIALAFSRISVICGMFRIGHSSEHPYIKKLPDNKNTLAKLQARYMDMVEKCLYLPFYQRGVKTEIRIVRGEGTIGDVNRYVSAVSHLYYSDFNAPDISVSLQYRAVETQRGESRLLEIYTIPDTETVCYIEFMKMVQFGLNVRSCHNCGAFFISKGDYDTKYCDRKPTGEEHTCQQIGAVKAYQAKVADNPVLAEYGKLYRRYHSRKRNGIITPEQFTAWTKQTVKIRDKAVRGNSQLEQFREEIDGISI